MTSGTWADWVSCAVSLLSAIAVLILGYQANKMGKASHKLAETSQQIAAASDAREGRTLLMYVFSDVRSSWDAAVRLHARLQDPLSRPAFCNDQGYRDSVARDLELIAMPTVESHLLRLHTADATGDALANALSMYRMATLNMKQANTVQTSAEREFPFQQVQNIVAWINIELERVQDRMIELGGGVLRHESQKPVAGE